MGPFIRVVLLTLLVRDYDEAIRFYVDKLGFELIEDTPLSETKRWVRVRPPGSRTANEANKIAGAELLLAKAATPEQLSRVGNQTGGRVFLFLETDDFERDHARLTAAGVKFVRGPVVEPYGRVAVFEDLYGNKFDLIQPNDRK